MTQVLVSVPPLVNNTNEKDIFEFVFFHLEFFSVIYPLSFIDKLALQMAKRFYCCNAFALAYISQSHVKVPFEIYSKILRPQTQ